MVFAVEVDIREAFVVLGDVINGEIRMLSRVCGIQILIILTELMAAERHGLEFRRVYDVLSGNDLLGFRLRINRLLIVSLCRLLRYFCGLIGIFGRRRGVAGDESEDHDQREQQCN